MTLHAQARALLDRVAAAGYPPIQSYPAAVARTLFEKSSGVLDARGVPIGATEDRTIPGPGGPIPIRILTPAGAGPGPLPCLAYFHGGGFVLGNPRTHDVSCRMLANASGCLVVSVDYRLAPDHKFPAAVEDCLATTQWVAANAGSLGADPVRLAVGGDSAGGNLAAVVAQLARNAGGKPFIAYQLLIYPAVDAFAETESKRTLTDGYMLDRATIDWFNQCYVTEQEEWRDFRASPLRADDLSGLPPAYVITAGYDPLRDEGALYAAALARAGVPSTHVNYEGMIHGFVNMTGVMDQAREAIEAAASALKSALSA